MRAHPLRCRCGQLQGEVDTAIPSGRAVCYCRHCQMYAHFLGRPGDILNPQGGTEVVATLPRAVQFTAGIEHLACMSLKQGGLLRWYAACCHTPIGNTPRDPKVSYVGLLLDCLPDTPVTVEQDFGRCHVAVNTASARGRVKGTPMATFFSILKIIRSAAGARLSGRWRENPFFEAGSAVPRVAPRVMSPAERDALRQAVG